MTLYFFTAKYVDLFLVSLNIIENSYFCSQRKQPINLNQKVHLREKLPYIEKSYAPWSSLEGGVCLLPVRIPYSRDFESCTLGSYAQRWSTPRKKASSCAALWPVLRATVGQFAKFGKKMPRVRSEYYKRKGLRTDNFYVPAVIFVIASLNTLEFWFSASEIKINCLTF